MRLFGLGVERYFSQVGNFLECGLAVLYIILLSLTGTINQSVMIELYSLLRLFRVYFILCRSQEF